MCMMNITVTGAGYVGLVAAGCLGNSGHLVTCVRTGEARLKLLNQGISPIREKAATNCLNKALPTVWFWKGRIKHARRNKAERCRYSPSS